MAEAALEPALTDFTDELPLGTLPIFRALNDAGVGPATGIRNVDWVHQADDGVVVLHVWRDQLERRNGNLAALLDYRRQREEGHGRQKKRTAVVEALAANNDCQIRVVVLEVASHARKSAGARYDDGSTWLVEDTGDEFWIWRGRPSGPPIPATPTSFGNLTPERKEVVSRKIERDSRVKAFTVQRAGNQCEVAACPYQLDFAGLDVHHVTALGHGGSDHTDNTIALCPACHVRVHRGTAKIQAYVEDQIVKVVQLRRTKP